MVQFCGTISVVGFSWGNVWLGLREEPGFDGPVRVGLRWLLFFLFFFLPAHRFDVSWGGCGVSYVCLLK